MPKSRWRLGGVSVGGMRSMGAAPVPPQDGHPRRDAEGSQRPDQHKAAERNDTKGAIQPGGSGSGVAEQSDMAPPADSVAPALLGPPGIEDGAPFFAIIVGDLDVSPHFADVDDRAVGADECFDVGVLLGAHVGGESAMLHHHL